MKASLGNCLDVLAIVSEPLAQRILKRVLERSGHWSVIVSCESDALDALEAVMFDAMIIDIETLGLGSPQFINLVRMARVGLPRLPVIALNINSSASFLQQLDEIGVEAILAKPVPPTALIDTLNRVSNARASSSGRLA